MFAGTFAVHGGIFWKNKPENPSKYIRFSHSQQITWEPVVTYHWRHVDQSGAVPLLFLCLPVPPFTCWIYSNLASLARLSFSPKCLPSACNVHAQRKGSVHSSLLFFSTAIQSTVQSAISHHQPSTLSLSSTLPLFHLPTGLGACFFLSTVQQIWLLPIWLWIKWGSHFILNMLMVDLRRGTYYTEMLFPGGWS